MKTPEKFCGALLLALTGTLCAQSNLMYDGVNLATMKQNDALPLSSAKAVFDYREARKQFIPTDSAALRNMPRNPDVPANLEDIYYANNWLEVSSYFWLQYESFECYGKELYEADYIITDKKKGDIDLFLRSWHDGVVEPYIDCAFPFDNHPKAFGKRGKYLYRYFADVGDTPDNDFNVIVDYKNGILILEITGSGKVGDFNTKRRFRNAYMAIPKSLMNNSSTPSTVYTPSLPTPTPSTGNVSPQPLYSPVQPVLSYNENQFIAGEAAGTLSDIFQTYKGLVPDIETLKNMRPGNPITNSLEYDLYDYDWMELSTSEHSNTDRPLAGAKPIDLIRFHPQAGTYRFSLTPASGRDPARLRYLNNWNRNVTTVLRQGSFTYLANGNQPVMSVISYDNNLLIVDEKDAVSGTVFRRAYFAVPKAF